MVTNQNEEWEQLLSKVELIKDMILESWASPELPEPVVDSRYRTIRMELLKTPSVSAKLPSFVRRGRTLSEVCQFIAQDGTDLSFRDTTLHGFEEILDLIESKVIGVPLPARQHFEETVAFDCKRCLERVIGKVEYKTQEPVWIVSTGSKEKGIDFTIEYLVARCTRCDGISFLSNETNSITESEDQREQFARVYPRSELADSRLPPAFRSKLNHAVKALYTQQFESVSLWCKNALEVLQSLMPAGRAKSSVFAFLEELAAEGVIGTTLFSWIQELEDDTGFLREPHPRRLSRTQAESLLDCTQEILNSVLVVNPKYRKHLEQRELN